jgi:hypothetical protein
MENYNGYKNYNTWNVALWLSNDYPLYSATIGYAKYGTPFLSLRHDLKETFNYTATKDGVSLWSRDLDIQHLNDVINEMIS